MKKIICLIICISFCLCFWSCGNRKEEDTQEVSLTTQNLKDYVAVNLSFGDVNVTESSGTTSPSSITTPQKTYYLSCICYVDIVPTGDYKFDSVQIKYDLPSKTEWKAVEVNGSEGSPSNEIKTINSKSNLDPIINLDKDGYGSTRIYMYYKSDFFHKPKSLNEAHPTQSGDWALDMISVSGTVTLK